MAPTAQHFATGFDGGVELERAPNGDLVYVSFGDGLGAGSVQRIVYGNRAPVARSTAAPSQGAAPLAATLSADGSTDPDGEAMTYEWDLDSDGSRDATGPSVRHTYPAGAHTVTLTVRDARDLAASDSVDVLADESPPTATLLAPAAGTPSATAGRSSSQGRARTPRTARWTRPRCAGGSRSITASTPT